MFRLPDRFADHVARRCTPVTVFVALLLGASACLVLGIAFPMTPQAPVAFASALLLVALGLAAGTWFAHERVTDRVLLAEIAVVIVLQGAFLSAAHTAAGVIVDASGFAWIVAYVALVFPRWAAPFAALSIASLVTGVVVGGVDGLASATGVVALTIAAVAVVLGRLSIVFARHLHTDPLTGVLNRAGLEEAAGRARRRGSAAVAILDLDAFKAVNDEHGHLAGDRLLAAAADAWRDSLRRGDVLARTGGDEFVVVMPDTGPQEAQRVLKRLALAHPVAFSAGLSCTRPWEAFDAAVERADRDLYRVKATRRAPIAAMAC